MSDTTTVHESVALFADITAREGRRHSRRSGERGPPPLATAPVRDLPPGALL
ncbi:hypothetical protein [Streptomyces sp. NPDC059787]|uniref:hypothetical protein n=1 Tax=Streptomyces sp. NPDC059787 TaxID=3346947 RepID=UPI00364A937A